MPRALLLLSFLLFGQTHSPLKAQEIVVLDKASSNPIADVIIYTQKEKALDNRPVGLPER